MKRILIVNDSPVLTSVMRAVVQTEPGYQVAGTFSCGEDALQDIARLKPDLVLMDIHMPGLNGVETTRKILDRHPGTRILITTATINRNMRLIFDGLKCGAVDFVRSPSLPYAPGTRLSATDLRSAGGPLLRKISTALQVSAPQRLDQQVRSGPREIRPPPAGPPPGVNGKHPILGIGCSTGGPTTLVILLQSLPRPLAGTVMVCQHIEPEFDYEFARWVSQETGFSVEIGRNTVRPCPDRVYVAPAGKNMTIGSDGTLRIETPGPEQIYTPNIDRLLSSMAEQAGRRVCGIVLTGMGNDGAKGIKAIRTRGGTVLVQDEGSAVVDSMPRAARIQAGGLEGHPPDRLGLLAGRWMNQNGT